MPGGLQRGRAWQSASVLADGSVLVLGGRTGGQIVNSPELLLPDRKGFRASEPAGSLARAMHTATLMTDGRLLVAGGIDAGGEPTGAIELWDSRSRAVATLRAALPSGPRARHSATLLSSGEVLIWGGVGPAGQPRTTGDLFDPKTDSLRSVDATEAARLLQLEGEAAARMSGSLPASGVREVLTDQWIGLLFSRPLRMASITARTLVLRDGGLQDVAIQTVSAGDGRLVFVIPERELAPGQEYTLAVEGMLAEDGTPIPPAEIRFSTAVSAISSNGADGKAPPQAAVTTDPPPLPPLQAAPGQTAFSGRVFTVDSKPLPGVEIELICGSQERAAASDATGRFLVTGVPSGQCKMEIDGTPASRPGKKYGIHFAAVTIAPGVTNVLPYYIWLTELDTAHAVQIPSPTRTAMVITNPTIKGLELHLPAGATITDYNGKPVTEISITQIPVGRPPFPLPPEAPFIMYFTIQPGGGYIKVSAGSPGARVIYPNTYRAPAGTVYNFWHYDASGKGWYIYGKGAVSADARSIVPDPGVYMYEFTGASVATVGSTPPNGPNPSCGKCTDGDPVDLATGLFVYSKVDLTLSDIIPLRVERTYRPGDSVSRAFGIGTTHTYDIFIAGEFHTYSYMELFLPSGGRVRFDRISPGGADAVLENKSMPGEYYKARITWASVNGTWEVRMKDGTVLVFPPPTVGTVTSARLVALKSIRDRYGNTVTIARDNAGNITSITSPSGRRMSFTNDTSKNRITRISDASGRSVNYAYDGTGRLETVTDVGGGVTRFGYDANNQITLLTDAKQIPYLQNEYDGSGRVFRQTLADGGQYLFNYSTDAGGNITQTQVTAPGGYVKTYSFNVNGYFSGGYLTQITEGPKIATFAYQSGTNLLSYTIDPIGRRTDFTYDAAGNPTMVNILPLGASSSTTWSSAFNQPLTITDPIGRITSFVYDSKGNLTQTSDPSGRITSFSFNNLGQMVSRTNATGTTTFSYSAGLLASATSPMGRIMSTTYDAVGRPLTVTYPGGVVTRYEYDALNQVRAVTEPNGARTVFDYDSNGNMLNVLAPSGLTQFTYDSMDRLKTRTDSLNKTENYFYNAAGALDHVTDRKSQTLTYGYDTLGRSVNVTYHDGSLITLVLDNTDRVTAINDSANGNISLTPNLQDLAQSETAPQGSVSYSYNLAGQRLTMTGTGIPGVGYLYDPAGRIRQITQGADIVTMDYDLAGRRKSLTLPNGVTGTYTYDADAQLVNLVYTKGGTALGNLAYDYDQAGRVIRTSGALARTGLPSALSQGLYDANNRLTQWGAAALTYDDNGNMTSDGTNAYGWNVRDQLASVSGGNSASFLYDGKGRRRQGPAGRGYFYDGINPVAELTGSTVTARNLAGLGIDEYFARTDSTGTYSLLTDRLGSTNALTDATGAIQGLYTYEPFGRTTATGSAAGSNPLQFAGRENDGTGLYYYRARYYHPGLGRFISEDPLGFAGGPNLYEYVGGDPISGSDPLGLARYLILVGQPGVGGLNAGNLFRLAASTEAALLRAAGHTVAVKPVVGVRSFGEALMENGYIDGGVVYFGHGGVIQRTGELGLFPGDEPVAAANITESNVRELGGKGGNLGPNASLSLRACNTAAGGRRSIAQQIADQLKRGVYGYEQGMFFSQNPNATRPDSRQLPNATPIYLRPWGGGTPVGFVPR